VRIRSTPLPRFRTPGKGAHSRSCCSGQDSASELGHPALFGTSGHYGRTASVPAQGLASFVRNRARRCANPPGGHVFLAHFGRPHCAFLRYFLAVRSCKSCCLMLFNDLRVGSSCPISDKGIRFAWGGLIGTWARSPDRLLSPRRGRLVRRRPAEALNNPARDSAEGLALHAALTRPAGPVVAKKARACHAGRVATYWQVQHDRAK
jgi:hypothetical protein